MIFTIDSLTAILIVMILVSTVYTLPHTPMIDTGFGSDIIRIYLQTRSTEHISQILELSNRCGTLYVDGETAYHLRCQCKDQIVVRQLFYEDGWHDVRFKYCQ